MSMIKLALTTCLAMLAFAANSVLCRLALANTGIDAASFTTIRLVSGAVVLCAIVLFFSKHKKGTGNWVSAIALFVYAAGFSFAYGSLSTATGALLLFGSVQAFMWGGALLKGERFVKQQLFGLCLAVAGLVAFLLPGLTAPPLVGSLLMIVAGVAWGVYTLRGKGAGDPTGVSAGNFLRASGLTLLLSALMWSSAEIDRLGVAYAVASGAIASGLGYAVWYTALPQLRASTAAIVQLSVPILAAVGGMLFMSEQLTVRFMVACVAILGGIALVLSTSSVAAPSAKK